MGWALNPAKCAALLVLAALLGAVPQAARAHAAHAREPALMQEHGGARPAAGVAGAVSETLSTPCQPGSGAMHGCCCRTALSRVDESPVPAISSSAGHPFARSRLAACLPERNACGACTRHVPGGFARAPPQPFTV